MTRKFFEDQAILYPAKIYRSELDNGLDSLATKFLADFPLVADIKATHVGVGVKVGVAGMGCEATSPDDLSLCSRRRFTSSE